MDKKTCSKCQQESRWHHDNLEDCVDALVERINVLENKYADLENILQQVEKLGIGKTPMAMKRIVRDQRLTPQETKKYNKIREQIEQELPDLIARHHDRMVRKVGTAVRTAADEAANKLSDELEKSMDGFISVGATAEPHLIVYVKKGIRLPENFPIKYEGYLIKVSYIQTPRPAKKK